MLELEKSETEIKAEIEAREAGMAAKLAGLEKKVEGTEVLARILADPEVRAILEAKQRGEAVKVVSAVEKVESKFPGFEADVDFEAMSNRQLAEATLGKFNSSLESLIASKLAPIKTVLQSLESYVGSSEARTVAQQVEEVKKKYLDFDSLLPEMRELNQVNPGLSVEELYIISKSRKVGNDHANIASSERPSTNPRRVPEEKKRITPLPKGNAGFDQLLSEALDKLELDI